MIRIERHGDVVQLEMSSKRSRVAGFAVSAYLVRGVLIDSGFPAVAHEVTRLLASERLRGVALTHHHEDHAGNVEEIARRGIPILARSDTLALARSPGPMGYYRRVIWGEPAPLVSAITPLVADELQLVHTPGHSSDHACVWDAETRTLFSGDLFLGVKLRLARPEEEPRALVDSLRRVSSLGPLRMFDAHRGAVDDPAAALRAKVTWMEETIGRIEQLATRGLPEVEITREVLGRPGSNDWFSRGDYSKRNLVRRILETRPLGGELEAPQHGAIDGELRDGG